MNILKPHSQGRLISGPVVCVVMDGVGEASPCSSNAVSLAHTPVLDQLRVSAPWITLLAHGTHVGMPSDNDMGNSEVGHNTLGAGRVFVQGAKLVDQAIETESIYQSPHWKTIIERSMQGGTLHFLGLISDGNVHSHIKHLKALVTQAAKQGVSRIRIHGLLDGRDVGEFSALEYFAPLEDFLNGLSADAQFASGGGRMVITMDRYQADWSMVERGWKTHVLGEGPQYPSATAAIEDLRKKNPGVTDQFLPPFVIEEPSRARPLMQNGDSVIFFNFRGDRAIEISQAFAGQAPFSIDPPLDIFYVGMMQYDGDLQIPQRYLVAPPTITQTVGELFAQAGVKTLACSETQKFGHVTFFWNGNRSGKFDDKLETYIEVPSDNVSFEQRPWMKAAEITDAVLNHLDQGFDHIRINYANGDMVGHTGHLDATRLAVEALDLSLGRLIPQVLTRGGALLITADHGNADQMFKVVEGEKVVVSSHTLNPVPCFLVTQNKAIGLKNLPQAGLANVAATLCHLLGFQTPEGYQASLLSMT